MRRRKLLWQLLRSYLLITVLAVAAVGLYAGHSLRGFYYAQTVSVLEARARLLDERLGSLLAGGSRADTPAEGPSSAEGGGAGPLERAAPAEGSATLRALVGELGDRSSTRVTVVLPSGVVLADSHEDASLMENHADRPEIAAAVAGGVGTSRRYSHTLGKELVYVAMPIIRDGEVVGVVRAALPRTALDEELGAVLGRIFLAAVLLSLFAAGVSVFVSRRLTGPIEAMRLAATRFANGDFKHDVPLASSEELASLADSLNGMAAELDARIRMVTQQRAEQEAVLASMVEGVIAVDRDERVIALNMAASGMLGVDPENARGLPIQEVIRNTDLHEFSTLALAGDVPMEQEFVLAGEQERFVQAHGTALKDGTGRRTGAVIVLNDVTRMRRLEQVRRDFVANVSHELRTPITSIKGFVETLIDGAGSDPESAARFLSIIAKHADRLNAIIEDLLFLSRIEQERPGGTTEFGEVSMTRVIDSVVDGLEATAAQRRIEIVRACEGGVRARANGQLLEHALANILDNAIKYSDEGGRVLVTCERGAEEVVIGVKDDGPGIAAADIHRIFERFYRVDKARSSEMGGTGLGLAISKHIVQTHGGHITVDSALGLGSTFSVHIPAA